MGVFKKNFRSIKKFPDWVYIVPALLLWLLVRIFYRVRVEDPCDHINQTEGSIAVAWHNRLLLFPVIFPKKARKRTVAVVSASRDGQYIADLIKQFGLESLRGSSSRRGANAEIAAVHALNRNKNVAFTPDGPRGPKYHLKAGPVHLASMTGRGIIPISINVSRYWQVKSWDNFQIAKPFSRVTLILGEKIFVPEKLSDEELEKYRKKVEDTLMAITVD